MTLRELLLWLTGRLSLSRDRDEWRKAFNREFDSRVREVTNADALRRERDGQALAAASARADREALAAAVLDATKMADHTDAGACAADGCGCLTLAPVDAVAALRKRYEDVYVRLGKALSDAEQWKQAADRHRANCEHLARERDRVIIATGMVTHATDEECVGCGCRSLTAEEAVALLRRDRDEYTAAADSLVVERAAAVRDLREWKAGVESLRKDNDQLRDERRYLRAALGAVAAVAEEARERLHPRPATGTAGYDCDGEAA